LHNWSDEDAGRILQCCRRAMTPGVGGRERTEEEYRALLRRSGFELVRVIGTTSPLSLIEAVAR